MATVCLSGTYVDAIGSVILGELVQGLDLVTGTFTSELIDGLARVDAADHTSVGTVDSGVSIKLVLNKLLLLLGEARHWLPLTANLAAIPIRKCQRDQKSAWSETSLIATILEYGNLLLGHVLAKLLTKVLGTKKYLLVPLTTVRK